MNAIDVTMKSPISNLASAGLMALGVGVAFVVQIAQLDFGLPNLITISHGVLYVIAMCLIIACQHPPEFVRWVAWLACLYTQGYVGVIILFTAS